MSKLLSGVRNSCDMFAKNSDLYFDVRASCDAFSSSACRACSTSRFFRATSSFWSTNSLAFSSNSALVCCNSSCCACNSRASDCDCLRRSSVRMFASSVFNTMPMDSVSWSRNAKCVGLNFSKDASSMTALTIPSKTMGRTIILFGVGLLQLLLLRLQFARQRLRLLEEILGSHVRFERVQHDADGFGELVQERQMRWAELLEGCKFHDRLDHSFENNGQNDNIIRP